MIQVKKTPVLSAKTIGAFGPHSANEWKQLRKNRNWFYANTDRLWTLYHDGSPVCVIGLRCTTWLGTGSEIYFLLCREFNRVARAVIAFLRRALRRIVRCLGSVTVKVEHGFWVGHRFVSSFGFKKVGSAVISDVGYDWYEMRASWA